jgi:hypothetical protein
MKYYTDVATLVKYGGEVELKRTLVITWTLFMYFDITCSKLIYDGPQLLCIIYLITNINIIQIVIFFFY